MADSLSRLASLVKKLRRECPWDREQTMETLRTYLLEETYEALAAMDSEDPKALRDELGDLLFQIFFVANLAAERGWFDLEEVARETARKMRERHPHVFGKTRAKTARQVKERWERRKRQTLDSRSDPFGSLPATLPALATAYRQTSRAADLGFDWGKDSDVAAKMEEELSEWRLARRAGDREAEAREIGDLLLTAVNLARRRGIDPEGALRKTNRRFRERFGEVLRRAAESGRDISRIPMEELDRYWEEAKREEPLPARSRRSSKRPTRRPKR